MSRERYVCTLLLLVKAFSLSSVSTKYWREWEEGMTKHQSEGTLWDVKAGRENHSQKTQSGEWDGEIGPPDAADGWGEHKQKKRRNQVKGAGSSTYEVIAHISLHPTTPPPTIESCGKRIEMVRDGKSIWDASRGLNWWLLWLHDSSKQECRLGLQW